MENSADWDIYDSFIFKMAERREHEEESAELYRAGDTDYCRQMANLNSLSAACCGWVINTAFTAVRAGKTPCEALTEVRDSIDQRISELIASDNYHPGDVQGEYSYTKARISTAIRKMENT